MLDHLDIANFCQQDHSSRYRPVLGGCLSYDGPLSTFPLRTKGPEDVQADQTRPNLLRLSLSYLRVQDISDSEISNDLVTQVS